MRQRPGTLRSHQLTFLDSIICGDAAAVVAQLPSASVDCVVTSPPYYGQRDYTSPLQIGLESTPNEYVRRLVELFTELRRVLSDTGTAWVNLGDKYQDSQLLGMPWRLALALQDDGWILRSDIIWHKPNAMPLSVKNRFTPDHEYMFLFVKSRNYYFDSDIVREPHVTFSDQSRMRGGRNHFGKRGGTPEKGKNGGNQNLHDARWDQAFHPKGRNRRTVWQVPLSKFPEAHFAVFPEKLIEPCILAGSPKGGVVLDPFSGSGTTSVVSMRLGRHYVGIDCNETYCDMARRRLRTQVPLRF
jgi:site-specific DNA-methyltransferase (adenine-specific)